MKIFNAYELNNEIIRILANVKWKNEWIIERKERWRNENSKLIINRP